VADFGLSKIINDGVSVAKTFVGTPQYWAPEVLEVQRSGGSYDQSADFWSLGAVLFVMLSGKYPFDGKKMPLEEQIRIAGYNMNTAVWQRISEEAKDLVQNLLKVVPSERYGMAQCVQHAWLAGSGSWPVFPRSSGPCVTEVTPPSSSSTTTPADSHHGPMPMITQPSIQSADSGNSQRDSVDERGATHSSSNVCGQREIPAIQGQSIQFGMYSPQIGVDDSNESIFCLNELLKLQVSIAGSLEMACLAFRHADKELTASIRTTFRHARELSQHAVIVVARYAQVAQQVSGTVLPDMELAVQEKEPGLAVSLLNMVKSWVADMKKDGEEMKTRYVQLQESVQNLIVRAQNTKFDADRRLAEAVQAVETEAQKSPREQPSQQYLTAGESCSPPRAKSFGPEGAHDDEGPNDQTNSATKGIVSMPFQLNAWTRQLFEQLGALTAGNNTSMITDPPDVSSGEASAIDNLKQDVLDLLFMAPGSIPTSFPKEEDSTVVALGASKGSAMSDAANDSKPNLNQRGSAGDDDHSVVRFTQSAVHSGEAAAQSSASLLRALRELKRVDEILHGCLAFWSNMDGTVQKLTQMKDHTERLVGYATNSKVLKERFDQRFGEYTTFWASLERLCRQYCVDHQSASKRMYEFIRDVNDVSDMIDTAESAKFGVMSAMRENQRRHVTQ